VNIVLLHYAALPVVGGVETVIGHHAHLMVEDGHNVRVLAGRGGQVDPRIPFIQFPLAGSRHPQILEVKAELDEGRLPAKFSVLVSRLSAELEPILSEADMVIAHNVCSLHKNLPLTAALKSISEKNQTTHLVLWHHDLAWTSARYQDELHSGYPWDLLRAHWPGTTQVVVSELRRSQLAELQGVAPESIHVVPNGVDAHQFLKLEPQTEAFVEQLALFEAEPLLLLPVRITARKNIELALRTMAALREKSPRAKLVITGPLGPHNPANKAYFEQLLALRRELGVDDAVTFLAQLSEAFLPDRVIADFYHLSDALLLPSWEEGFGIPVLEAGLAGLPVFCSDIPPLRELGGQNATYFSPDEDPVELANLIVSRLSADPIFALRVQVRKAYTWERVYRDKIAPLLGVQESDRML
jgi:glycosyltransferase involved in cell wall biosynthesis